MEKDAQNGQTCFKIHTPQNRVFYVIYIYTQSYCVNTIYTNGLHETNNKKQIFICLFYFNIHLFIYLLFPPVKGFSLYKRMLRFACRDVLLYWCNGMATLEIVP